MHREYNVKGQKIRLAVDKDVVAVRFKKNSPNSLRSALSAVPHVSKYENRVELDHDDLVIIPLEGAGAERGINRHSSAMSAIDSDPSVETVKQVFKSGNKRLVAAEQLIVGFDASADNVNEVLKKYKLKTIEKFGDNEQLVQAAPGDDPIDIVNSLCSENGVDYAEPDFVIVGQHIVRRSVGLQEARRRQLCPAGVEDPLAIEQYAVFITEANEAWNIATGAADVRIAILDEGVDTLHPDLADAVVGTYDATDDDEWQQPNSWDGHGTACAGLAAAIHCNGEGIKGIGGGCSLLAVRIAFSRQPGGHWITTNNWIRRAIDWCVDNGAAVLSNSWGGGAYNQSIVNAFKRAGTKARGGKGAVVVAAAGNANGPVDFPGNLDGVLTVSASNEYDEFKTKISRDGEHWWGSNFGPEVDVAAPGVHNLTTDIRGSGGYTDTNYTDFNGTSSSTPIVAGACGLLLSADGELSESEVREIMKETADKVGQFAYAGDRNDQMGHGRINVLRAVQRVVKIG